MSKAEILELLKLLSAMESWSFSTGAHLPDYLGDKLAGHIDLLTEVILNEQKT